MKARLEQILLLEKIGGSTIDSYAFDTITLYTEKPFNPSPFFPTSTGFGIKIDLPRLPDIRDYHETFKIDRYDNIYGGHSSITGNKKKKSFWWEDD